jgi:hypothetical protein
MPGFGIVNTFPGGTKEQYEAVIAHVHATDGSLPKGQTFHAAGASEDGWIVIRLWDSRESYEQFHEALLPRLEAIGDAGFTSAPQETMFEIHSEQSA